MAGGGLSRGRRELAAPRPAVETAVTEPPENAAPGPDDLVRDDLARGDVEAALARTLDLYGVEIGGYLGARLRDDTAADEVFSDFAVDVWKGLPGFRFEASLRTWLYTVARRAIARHAAGGQRRRAHELPLSAAGPVSRLGAQAAESVRTWLRESAHDRLALLRASLDEADAELLILRVDRALDWRDIAVIQGAEGDEAIRKAAATLRKRFERLKQRLRREAEAAGILAPR